MPYDETRAEEAEGAGRGGPSPYDVADEDMPDERVITKGEREKPGPTDTGIDSRDRRIRDHSDSHVSGTSDAAHNDGLLQTSQVDRTDGPGPMAGMSGSLEEEEALEANEATGSLGGEGLHRRINQEAIDDDTPGDEESA